MTTKNKNICIIPARGGSKRLLKKNLAIIDGQSLVEKAITIASASNLFEKIVVSSDDQEILSQATAAGATAAPRPESLAGDSAQYRLVCQHHLIEYSKQKEYFQYMCVLIPSNPMRTVNNILESYDMIQKFSAKSVLSVVAYNPPPQRALCIQENYLVPYFDKDKMLPTQQLETLYYHDGLVIWCDTLEFIEKPEFYTDKSIPYIVNELHSADIDTPLDLEWAKFLTSKKQV